jgi:DNA (cytosine-5)-methyltransferase 1
MTLKILNLYSGIGGNRRLWSGDISVTAIELVPEIAKIYKDLFPDDEVIVADAHQYLLEHYRDYDFIWSSPPCPTHSGVNFFLNAQGVIRYPDMSLWQEIIFLQHFFKGKYVVENVESYYEPFLKLRPQNIDRHFFWANFSIMEWKDKIKQNSQISICNARDTTRRDSDSTIKKLQSYHGISLDSHMIANKRKLLANCVNPRLGLHIFRCAFNEYQSRLDNKL